MSETAPAQPPDQTASADAQVSVPDDAIESVPTHILQEPQVQEPQVQEPHVSDVQVSVPDDAIESVPTHILQEPQAQESQAQELQAQEPQAQEPQAQEPQVQGPSLSYVQTRVQSVLQSLSARMKHRPDMKRVPIWLALVAILLVVSFVVVQLLQALIASIQPSIKTTVLGTTVNYAGVDITVVNAQESQKFVDDPHSTSDGMLRLQLRAQNKTSLAINLPYETIAHVTLPDGQPVGRAQRVLNPTYVKSEGHVAPHATESSLVDFAVPQNVRVDQVIFHLGGADEAQLDIPLNRQADVGRYASKTIHPNQPISFYGLNWSLTDATAQFHIDGKQASKGKRYLILTLKVDNPLAGKAIPGSPYGYVQLQADQTPIDLINTTLPVAFEVGASGKTGTLMFLVPQGDTSFTLTLSNEADGFDGSSARAKATFQL
jgi:hypothetical protein